jgi:peptidoglycan/LPS O-acetylase OafA/YrhL
MGCDNGYVVAGVQNAHFKERRTPDTQNTVLVKQGVHDQQHAASPHPKYRPDIDGLRALAVGSVVFYHAFPHRLTGGYTSVDIFFVISGCLISSILFAGFRQGAFSFADFYTRRARRIFPALITVLLPVGLFGWYVFTPDEFATLGKHIAAGSGFVANVALWLETGYFDTASDVKPLLHLWSLGVEEQFYIVWPVLLWATWRVRANVLIVGTVLAAASFMANVGGIEKYAEAVFYLPIPRFWELLSGAALAYMVVIKGNKDAGSLFAHAGTAGLSTTWWAWPDWFYWSSPSPGWALRWRFLAGGRCFPSLARRW